MDISPGLNHIKQKNFVTALNFFLKLEKNYKQDLNIFFYLGIVFYELGDFKKSIYYYEEILKINPNSINALYNLAIVKQSIGEIETAKKIYNNLKKIDIDKIKPYYGLFTLNPKYLSEEDFENISLIKENKIPSLYDLGLINFLLSKREKKNKKFENEIELLNMFHSCIFHSKYEYNMSARFYYKQIINKNFDKIEFTGNKGAADINNSYLPLFIIGLPRSGSTLLESVLKSSKENILSVGECNVINGSILEQIGPKIYTKNFNNENFKFEINREIFDKSVLNRYLQFNLNEKENKIFIDKSLENFFNIEIIIKTFPNAKFLHTFRNPIDSVISIYQSMLAELSWTHSIEDILNYMDYYYKAVNYFKKKYPQNFFELDLEKFSNTPEKIAKDIYKFCNLTWTEDSLNFYKRRDLFSKTLSYTQIRNKITKYDSKKYENYFYLLERYKKKYGWLKI
mgnify:FL=1